jgi:hypothetical protein
VWRHQAPLDITEWDTDSSGVVQGGAELDPEGADYSTPPPQGGTPDQQPMQSRFGDPLTPSSVLIDGMSASTLQVGILLFSAEARGGLPGALGGSSTSKFQPMTAKWNGRVTE